ncbi:MAG: extracellular solute-binding protein [Firmicutes bacterium]|nr:extracellular solute-binding protein [Bacillota bacterium]
MRKRGLFLLIMLFVVASLGLEAAPKTKIVVGCFPALDEAYAAVLPEFYKKYPQIEVEIKALGFDDHHSQLVTALAAGEGAPDVAAVEIGYVAQFVAEGGLVDLLKPPFNAGRYRDGVTPYTWAQGMSNDGRLIAMPADIAPGCAFYRRDVFAAHGINVDDIKTIEDLYEVGKKVSKDLDGDGKNDTWLISDASSIAWMIIRSAPELYFDEKGNCLVDSERFRLAFEWAKKFQDDGLAGGIAAWTNEWYVAFQTGTVAYEPSGAWLGGHLKNWMAPDTAGKWGVTEWPALRPGEDRMAGYWGGTFLAIPEQSKHKEEAWAFIEFITTNVNAQKTCFEVADCFPAWMAAWEDKLFEEKMDFFAGQQARLLWIDIAKRVPEVITNRFDSVANSVITSELGAVLQEGKPVERALRDAKTQIERRVRRGR